jgi:D-sedoheptulose 7-phosphate isomerase
MEQIKRIIQASIQVKETLVTNEALLQTIAQVADLVVTAFKNNEPGVFLRQRRQCSRCAAPGGGIFGRFYIDRKALPAEALHCNTSYLTAVANDYSYDVVYARLLEGIGMNGDVLIGLSTSGNSGNIIKAFETARNKGITTVGFTGAKGGKMKEGSDYLINAPSTDTPRIQETHILIGHIICQLVEEKYFATA